MSLFKFFKRANRSFYGGASYCAFLLDDLKEYKESIAEILSEKQAGRSNSHAMNNLGVLYWEIGELEGARSSFAEAVALDPNNATAFKNIGMLAEKSGDFTKALTAFAEALRISPRDYSLQLNMAYLLLDLDRPSDSIPFFEAAIALGFDNEIVREKMALATSKAAINDD